jgi:hypothetical protein
MLPRIKGSMIIAWDKAMQQWESRATMRHQEAAQAKHQGLITGTC